MSKDAYIRAHEQLIAEQMEATDCSWEAAYNDPVLQDKAYHNMREHYANVADEARKRARENF